MYKIGMILEIIVIIAMLVWVSIINFIKLFLRSSKWIEKLVLQEVLIAAFASENDPLFQTILGVFFADSANFDHLVFVELILLL